MIEAFVSSNSTCMNNYQTLVCFIAGVLTYRNNFEAAAKEIAKRYPLVKVMMIFPYGMADGTNKYSLTRLLARQLVEAGYDLAHGQSRRVDTITNMILEQGAASKQLILIGHSAGGVIAYRTGLLLDKIYGFQEVQAFAVGSPKFYLKEIPYNKRFTYITGQSPDRITRIGSWRRPGSRVFQGKPGRVVQMDFNPGHQGWRFHASYFLNSTWTDDNQIFHSNAEDLIAKIHEICPDPGMDS